MFAARSMRPEWCFVAEAEHGERPLGRVALWTLPGMEEPFALVLLDLPWDGDYTGVGTRLLEYVLEKARVLGAEEMEHVVDDPPMRPQFQDHAELRVELLESVGFAFRRETGRFEWRGGETPTVSGRMTLRTLEEVGEVAFVEAMREVSEGTLDREIQGERERLGAQRAAREFFEDARRVEHDPAWWRLAYTLEGELVGLVMPAEPTGFFTIFYVGVVPGMRGQGTSTTCSPPAPRRSWMPEGEAETRSRCGPTQMWPTGRWPQPSSGRDGRGSPGGESTSFAECRKIELSCIPRWSACQHAGRLVSSVGTSLRWLCSR